MLGILDDSENKTTTTTTSRHCGAGAFLHSAWPRKKSRDKTKDFGPRVKKKKDELQMGFGERIETSKAGKDTKGPETQTRRARAGDAGNSESSRRARV